MDNKTFKNSIFVAPDTDSEYPFWLCQFGKTSKHTPAHQIRLNSHVSCIQYVISGSGIIMSDNHTFNVRQGDTFILSEEKNQNYYSNSDNHFERIWINFKGVLGKELLKIYGLENTIVLRNTNSLNLLMEIHEKCKAISDPQEYKKESTQLFLKLVQFLADCKSESDDQDKPTDSIRLYIDTHITENISLADMAEHFHLSKEYIIRSFKKKYGITPHQYIINSKMKIADSMLRTGDRTIEEIASELNFSDSHHFSSQFKKNFGIRPSVFKQKFKKG